MSGFMLPIYNNEGAGYTAATLIAAGGTILMLIAQKQITGVKKTKNTVGLSEKFMQWYLLTCILLGLTSAFGIVATSLNHSQVSKNIHWIVIDSFFVVMNGYLFYSNYYTYKIKQENMRSAKKAGMTEGEHYEKVIAPSLLQVTKR